LLVPQAWLCPCPAWQCGWTVGGLVAAGVLGNARALLCCSFLPRGLGRLALSHAAGCSLPPPPRLRCFPPASIAGLWAQTLWLCPLLWRWHRCPATSASAPLPQPLRLPRPRQLAAPSGGFRPGSILLLVSASASAAAHGSRLQHGVRVPRGPPPPRRSSGDGEPSAWGLRGDVNSPLPPYGARHPGLLKPHSALAHHLGQLLAAGCLCSREHLG
jgi:hypothetical protein